MTFQKRRVPCRAVRSSGVRAGWTAAPCGTSKALATGSFFGNQPIAHSNPRSAWVHTGAFPVRALPASGGHCYRVLFDRLLEHRSCSARSTRRGSPRPCSLSMPRACSSRRPLNDRNGLGAGATARVRRPTLTTLPSPTHPRSQFILPTAPPDRRRPYNPRLQQTGTRLAPGASRRQARASS